MIRISKGFTKICSLTLFSTGLFVSGFNGAVHGSMAFAGEVKSGFNKGVGMRSMGNGQRSKNKRRYTVRNSVLGSGKMAGKTQARSSRGLPRLRNPSASRGNVRNSIRYSRTTNNIANVNGNDNQIVNGRNRINNSFNRTTNIRRTTRTNVKGSYNTYNNTTINVGAERSGTRLRDSSRVGKGAVRSQYNGFRSVMRQRPAPTASSGLTAVVGPTVIAPNYKTNNVHFGNTIIYGGNIQNGGGMREISGAGRGTSVSNCRYGSYCTINLGGPKIITFNDIPDYNDGLVDENLTEAQMQKKYGSK